MSNEICQWCGQRCDRTGGERQVAGPPCRIEGNAIVFPGEAYYILLTACSTPERIFGWIQQIGAKTWVTKEHILHFMYLATEYHGIQIHG